MTDIEYTDAVTLYEDKIFGFVFKNTRNHELSKEIVQEAYLKLWIHKVKVEVTKAKSWLFTTAYNHMINQLERENRYVRNSDGAKQHMDSRFESALTTTMPDFNQSDIIQAELNKLTQQQRRLVILRDVHGYSYDEIGERMKLSGDQVKSYLFRTRKILKDKFKELNRHGRP